MTQVPQAGSNGQQPNASEPPQAKRAEGCKHGIWAKVKDNANVGVAAGTFLLAIVAFWQGCVSRKAAESAQEAAANAIAESRKATTSAQEAAAKAIEESRQMRFADNLPAVVVKSKPGYSISVASCGKGPAIVLALGFQFAHKGIPNLHWALSLKQRNSLPVTAEFDYPWGSFDQFAQHYVKEWNKQDKGPKLKEVANFAKLREAVPDHFKDDKGAEIPIEAYVQYADVFGGMQYRQHYYFYPLTNQISPAWLSIVPEDDPDYVKIDPLAGPAAHEESRVE